MKNILVIGAHFDDPELGCGGTMRKLASEGKNVYKLILTDNKTNFKEMNIHVSYESSVIDSKKSCDILGVTELEFKCEECNNLKYETSIMQRIEAIIFEKNIDTVFMHFSSDVNQDHVASSLISLTAARHCENLFYYQSNGYILEKPFYPTVFFDISDFYQDKINALQQFSAPHDRFDRLFDIAIKRNDVWGYANKVKYAEGFVPVKCLFK